MLCRLFDDRKYMDIYHPIHQEYCYLRKQKISLYFYASTCEHLWPSPSHLVNYAKCLYIPSKDASDWSKWKNAVRKRCVPCAWHASEPPNGREKKLIFYRRNHLMKLGVSRFSAHLCSFLIYFYWVKGFTWLNITLTRNSNEHRVTVKYA